MPIANRSQVSRYTFTILAVTLATLVRFALTPLLGLEVPFILYYPTVVLCAWFGGLGPGLLSTALGGLAALYFFLPPQFSLSVSKPTLLAQLIIFSLAGALISVMAENLHRARRRTEESEDMEREQSEKLRVTLASIGDAVITTDAQGLVTFMNLVAESLTGWKQEDASASLLLRRLRADNIWQESTVIQDIFNLLIYSRIVIVDFSGRISNFILIKDRNRHTSDFHVAPSRLAEASRAR